jgi:hypothetical protein
MYIIYLHLVINAWEFVKENHTDVYPVVKDVIPSAVSLMHPVVKNNLQYDGESPGTMPSPYDAY